MTPWWKVSGHGQPQVPELSEWEILYHRHTARIVGFSAHWYRKKDNHLALLSGAHRHPEDRRSCGRKDLCTSAATYCYPHHVRSIGAKYAPKYDMTTTQGMR